jgi:cytochrome b561
MRIPENRTYTRVAIAFHWVIALLIALNFVAVWVADGMSKPEKMQIMANHKAIGITILILSALRILWRIAHRPPPLPASLAPWEAVLARAVHSLFYFLMIGMPLTGWAMISTGGQPVSVFGLFDMPALPVGSDKATGGTFHEVHEIFGTALLILIGLHVLGALKHQFMDHDGTLARMVPFLRERGGL